MQCPLERGKAEIAERDTIGLREHLTPRTFAADTLAIVKPFVGEELLAQMRELGREILH